MNFAKRKPPVLAFSQPTLNHLLIPSVILLPCFLAPSSEMSKFSNLDIKAANHKKKQGLRLRTLRIEMHPRFSKK